MTIKLSLLKWNFLHILLLSVWLRPKPLSSLTTKKLWLQPKISLEQLKQRLLNQKHRLSPKLSKSRFKRLPSKLISVWTKSSPQFWIRLSLYLKRLNSTKIVQFMNSTNASLIKVSRIKLSTWVPRILIALKNTIAIFHTINLGGTNKNISSKTTSLKIRWKTTLIKSSIQSLWISKMLTLSNKLT